MDPHSSPRFGRRVRYESFPFPPPFPDPHYSPYRYPPFASLATHPAVPTPPEIPRNHCYEPRVALHPGDRSYLTSPHRSNPLGFDLRHPTFPRAFDRAIHRSPLDGKHILPELWDRGRGGGGSVDNHGVFDEGPDRFQPYDNYFRLRDPDAALVARRRMGSEKDRFLGDESEWKNHRQRRFWNEREGGYHDPFLEQLPPVAAPLATAPPPFHSPRGLRCVGSVKNSGGEASCVFAHRHPPCSPLSPGRSFSNKKVVKSTGVVAGNSLGIGNSAGPQRLRSTCKRKSNARYLTPDCDFGGGQFMGHKSIKKSDPINVSNEDGCRSGHHKLRTEHGIIASFDNGHEFEENCHTGYNGKQKMTSNRDAKYDARLKKRPMQKPSAFSRIQSGLSVWERLEEKPLISPPLCSASCSLDSPPRITNETEAKGNIFDLSVKSNTLVAKVLESFNAVPSSIEKDLSVEKPNGTTKKNISVEKPNGTTKKNNRTQIREKVLIPIVSSFPGSSRNHEGAMKKKKKKNMIHMREKVVIPVILSSPGSFAKQEAGRNSDVSNLGNVSVLPEANKAEISSCIPGNNSLPRAWTKKVKKLVMAKKSGAKEVVKMINQVDGCIIETSRMEDGIETPKREGDINCAKEKSNFNRSDGTGTEPIDDSHLQICQKFQMMQATPSSNVSVNINTKDVNQSKDNVIEILNDSGKESLELEKKLDDRCRSSLDFDLNVCSQSSEYINNISARDSFMNMNENVAENSIKQMKSDLGGFVSSPRRKIGQYMPPSNNAESPELLDAGEVFVSAGSRTAYSDTSMKCINTEITMEREVKDLEKILFITATEELEVPESYASSESNSQGLQAPSFSEISDSAPEPKLHNEETLKENNMLSQSVCNTTFRDSLDGHTIDSCGERMGQALLLRPMKMDSPATHFENASHFQLAASERIGFSNNVYSGNENQEHGGKGEAFVSSMVSCTSEPGIESDKTGMNHHLMSEKVQLLPSDEFQKQVPPNPKLADEELTYKKNLPQKQVSVPRFLSNRLTFSVPLKEAARASQSGRHRTWLRTNTPLHSDENLKLGGILSKQVPKKLGKIQNSSYFRKGNSLIRKLAAELPPALLPTGNTSSRKFNSITETSVREIRSECGGNATPLSLFERPKTPSLLCPSKLPSFTMNSVKDFPQLIPMGRSPEPDTDQGNQDDSQLNTLLAGNLESQDTTSCKTVVIVNAKSVSYVKRKMNQLVAAPVHEVGDSSKFLTERLQIPFHHPIERSKTLPISSSYLYFRSKRNQLILNENSSDSKLIGIPAGNSSSVDSLKDGNTHPYKKRLDNVLQKAKNPTRSSLVWTSGGDKLSQKGIATFGSQSVIPYILPWKRAVNWKSFMKPNKIPISNGSKVSPISRKLQFLRKRNTIYKVSTNGFSLRKAGVVSIGGSSLKWSKSIEKRSKKASEEATLAVAEVERKKRERKKSGNGKNKESLTCRSTSGIELKRGERIFRVGSARYKMDSSMRTLLRIADDHSSSPTSQQPGNSSHISFVPRRLVIGNTEYVRIGNGNQLVRDPKKLKRILATEKVRWSLHSARLRLAQKHQYCLFFTRFGKCNKRGRACPYIHDPTKVAICTKFLKGQCSDTFCKLTHKIIPERMPDCSYFLKGLCTNLNCPYRHVKVNANATLCDGFLRGHCSDGDECRKKHGYTCPLFEATGNCPQGSLCKLHHPKNQSKSKKRKRAKIQSSSQGRYFYSSIGKAGEPLGVPSSQNDLVGSNDIFCSDGQFTEYIHLDVDDSYTGKLNYDDADMQSCDIDALIKPVRIMNRDDLTIF